MLARIALRIAAFEALQGKTQAADNVFDSRITTLDVDGDGKLVTDQTKPFITIYTEGSKIESGIEQRSLHKSGPTEFMIEYGIAATMTVVNPETEEDEVLPGIAGLDDAFEFYLDVVGRQITNALTDPNDPWAEIWRGLSSSIIRIEHKRTSDASGVRVAAHQLLITLDLLPDPVFGVPIAPTSIWAKLFAQLETVNHPFLPTMRSLLGLDETPLGHEGSRRRFGLTLEEARALCVTPPLPAETTEPNFAPVSQIVGP